MCIEDVRLGRKTAVIQQIKTVANTSGMLVDEDSNRTMLTIFPPPSGILTISIRDPVVTLAGVNLEIGNHPLELNIQTHGQLVMKRWFAIHSAGGVAVAYIEGQLDPSWK